MITFSNTGTGRVNCMTRLAELHDAFIFHNNGRSRLGRTRDESFAFLQMRHNVSILCVYKSLCALVARHGKGVFDAIPYRWRWCPNACSSLVCIIEIIFKYFPSESAQIVFIDSSVRIVLTVVFIFVGFCVSSHVLLMKVAFNTRRILAMKLCVVSGYITQKRHLDVRIMVLQMFLVYAQNL